MSHCDTKLLVGQLPRGCPFELAPGIPTGRGWTSSRDRISIRHGGSISTICPIASWPWWGLGRPPPQVRPAIQPMVGKLYLFQREPGWVMPKGERDLTDPERRRLGVRGSSGSAAPLAMIVFGALMAVGLILGSYGASRVIRSLEGISRSELE